ncbi:hypothetical protein ACH5RR_029824 [Cinchona calisaya]|uniref:Uncharacterized protein n=1 Tax=Cinchona calisaya TaxID=153742 RepID=A0ABD2YY00_9GENT
MGALERTMLSKLFFYQNIIPKNMCKWLWTATQNPFTTKACLLWSLVTKTTMRFLEILLAERLFYSNSGTTSIGEVDLCFLCSELRSNSLKIFLGFQGHGLYTVVWDFVMKFYHGDQTFDDDDDDAANGRKVQVVVEREEMRY